MIEEILKSHIESLNASTAAIQANTAALLQVLAASGATPAAAPAPAAKKPAKAAKLEVVETPAVEVAPTPEPVVEDTPEPKAPAATEPEPETTPEPEPEPAEAPEGFNRDEVLLSTSETVKAWVKASGADMMKNIKTYETLRAKYGVKNVTELDDANLAKIKVEIDAMIAAN